MYIYIQYTYIYAENCFKYFAFIVVVITEILIED